MDVQRPELGVYVAVLLFVMSSVALAKNTTTLDDVISESLRANSLMASQHPLSRKRRYLQFPEGSSFQMVYDLVLGVVDYSNYITISITMALAYELPSKPPSELLDDVKERIKDGTFDFNRKDQIDDIKYVDFRKNEKKHEIPLHDSWYSQTRYHYPPVAANKNYSSSPKMNPFYQLLRNSEQLRFAPQTRTHSQLSHGYNRAIRPIPRNIYKSNGPINSPSLLRNFPVQHRIYRILGKRIDFNGGAHGRQRRSGVASDILSKYDRIHIRHHRHSRHDMYSTIEKYLNRRNMDGQECVLRALCETAGKMTEQEPGTFIGELMRALFTMPEPLDDHARPSCPEAMYDRAHAAKANCATQYPKCGHSLWSSHFVK